MADPYAGCTFCPQLCRHTCPVVHATGREAATPSRIMALLREVEAGRAPTREGARAAALCTACGACRDHCRFHVDVPALLAAARGRLAPPHTPAPLAAVEGDAALVALECDGRPWSSALAARLGRPVARLATGDHLGEALLDHPTLATPWLRRLRAVLTGREVVSACGRCHAVLAAAGVVHTWLDDIAPPAWTGPSFACQTGRTLPGQPVATAALSCGAHGPLARVHPELARDLAREAAAHLPAGPVAVADACCRAALRGAGADALDPIDLLLQPPPDTAHTGESHAKPHRP
ncbi:MAG: (Fe-S)-binding protein [Pseudomonadota bacterium]